MENCVGLVKEPLLHSVGDREPLKSFRKRTGLLAFPFPEVPTKGVVRKMVDLDSSWRSRPPLNHEESLSPSTSLSWTGAPAMSSCCTWTSPCYNPHPAC